LINHNEAFLKLAADAKSRITEASPKQVAGAHGGGAMVIVDVREADEFAREHITGAVHISRGILEQRVADVAPDADTPIACYCTAGNRGALAADSLKKMGYTNVVSIEGGLKAWKAEQLPTDKS